MKTLRNTLLLTAACCLSLLAINCNRQKAPKTVDLPFTAEALGEYKYAGPDTLSDQKCTGSLSAMRVLVDATGTGTPMGKFAAHFDFCGDSLSHYGNGYAFLVDEKEDTLFFDVSGQVLDGRLEEHPEYVISYWKDTFKIIGGTGQYKGATGTIMSNDYNSSQDQYSHHNWTGTLTLIKGNQ
jgi:hypothetical protein